MTLDQIEKLANELIHTNLDHTKWKFKWNRQSKTFGICNYSRSIISLSKHLVPGEPDKSIKNIILHEIAHAIVGYGNGHNAIWLETAERIGLNNPQRFLKKHKDNPGTTPKWVVLYKNEIIHNYYRKPGYKVFNNIDRMWIPGKEEETTGNLKLIKYSDYIKWMNF